jgi:hypothetical protein
MTENNGHGLPPTGVMLHLITGYWVSQARGRA